jgi:hypothetical protein
MTLEEKIGALTSSHKSLLGGVKEVRDELAGLKDQVGRSIPSDYSTRVCRALLVEIEKLDALRSRCALP